MSQATTRKVKTEKRPGIVLRLWDMSVGNVWRFTGWSVVAIIVSILVEWIGMVFWWDLDHSEKVLMIEMAYLSQFNRNLITGVYPRDLAETLLHYCTTFVDYLPVNTCGGPIEGKHVGCTQRSCPRPPGGRQCRIFVLRATRDLRQCHYRISYCDYSRFPGWIDRARNPQRLRRQ
jgi:hypothetical protein